MEKQKRGRGKPPFKPTAAQKAKVRLWIAGGMTKSGIAEALGIARDTLDKYFAFELLNGAQTELAGNLELLKKAARKGNVTAMKFLDAKFAATAAQAGFESKSTEDVPPPRVPKMGKKEEAAVAAETAGQGSGWQNDLIPPGFKPN